MEEGWNSVKWVWSILLLMVVLGGAEGGEITCHAIRYTFLNKNLDVTDVPRSPQQGIYLIFSCIKLYFYPMSILAQVDRFQYYYLHLLSMLLCFISFLRMVSLYIF